MIRENGTDKEALRLVKRAIQDLMLFFPLCGLSYLGEAVVLGEDHRIDTLRTDGRRVWYSPKWIKTITHDARVFDLLHEWLHVFFNHPARCGDRKHRLWNHCVDIVVVREAVAILSRHGGKKWVAPADGVIPPEWAENMSAEQIYDYIILHSIPMPQGKKGSHNTSDDLVFGGPDFFIGDEEQFRQTFSDELAKVSLLQQQATGKSATELYGNTLARRIDEVVSPKVPWNKLLQGQLTTTLCASGFPTYSPPNRKFWPKIALPSFKKSRESKLVILVDVSSSVGSTLLAVFADHVSRAAARADETIVITFDQVVREEIKSRNPKQILKNLTFGAGHHNYTSTIEAFQRLDKHKPKAMCCLTDGYIELPTRPYPDMIWVVPQNGGKPPWGKTFTMDISW